MGSYLFEQLSAGFGAAAKPAFVSADGSVLTYGELRDDSARMAQALAALGVAPGDRVAVQVEKSIDAVVLYLACLRAGAVLLPLNTAYTPSEIAYFLSDATPHLFVCDAARRDALAQAAAHVAQVR